MGIEVVDHYEPHPTPKLSLSKLPFKTRQPIQMLTPPFHPSLSVPFQWEEEPGKPRATTEKAATPFADTSRAKSKKKATAIGRNLDLPPRLLKDHDPKFTKVPSPSTVLDGPYVGQSLSIACTFSFRKGPFTGRKEGVRPKKRSSARNLGSGRWESFTNEGMFHKGSLDFSLGDIVKSEENMKMTRIRTSRSFFSLSTMNSNLWADIYASFKQVVSWRRRTQESKMDSPEI